MKKKLLAALLSSALFSAGLANAAVGSSSYADTLQGDSKYQFMIDEYRNYDGRLKGSEYMHPESFRFIWDKLLPEIGKIHLLVTIINEWGIPALVYIAEKLSGGQTDSTCEYFYEYEDYLDDEMDEWDRQEYEDSSAFEEHEELSDEEYYKLKDFCYEERPRNA